MIEDFIVLSGRPIRSLQTFLRAISLARPEIPRVIPDGIFGQRTEDAVKTFQQLHGLPVTGSVDQTTWERIVEEYAAVQTEAAPSGGYVFPSSDYRIYPQQSCPCLMIIQHMLGEASKRFTNVPRPEPTGVHDARSVESVRVIQRLAGRPSCDGVVDMETWNVINRMYNTFINIQWQT